MIPEMLTVEQVVERYPISRTRLYRLMAANTIAAVKLGRLTYVLVESLEAYFSSLPPYTPRGPRNG